MQIWFANFTKNDNSSQLSVIDLRLKSMLTTDKLWRFMTLLCKSRGRCNIYRIGLRIIHNNLSRIYLVLLTSNLWQFVTSLCQSHQRCTIYRPGLRIILNDITCNLELLTSNLDQWQLVVSYDGLRRHFLSYTVEVKLTNLVSKL